MGNASIRAAGCCTKSLWQWAIAEVPEYGRPVSDSRIGTAIGHKVHSSEQQSWSVISVSLCSAEAL